jgi:uncharacterized protein
MGADAPLPDRTRSSRGVTCPTCQSSTAWAGNPHRPFCSLTCRLIDLGHWLDERYRVEADLPLDGSGGTSRRSEGIPDGRARRDVP